MSRYDRFVVVHPTSLNFPFWGKSDMWVADRDDAAVFYRDDAVKKTEELKRHFLDMLVLPDAWEHPEIETALFECFSGNFTNLKSLQAYREVFGHASLQFFVRKMLCGESRETSGHRLGKFNDLFENWTASQ